MWSEETIPFNSSRTGMFSQQPLARPDELLTNSRYREQTFTKSPGATWTSLTKAFASGDWLEALTSILEASWMSAKR
jgi:hypothetical protein